MKKLNKKTVTVVLVILVFLVFLCSAPFILSDSPIAYEIHRTFNFDCISYNGVVYYLMEDEQHPDRKASYFAEKIKVVIVDKNGKPFDDTRTEDAYLYSNDLFINMWGNNYTRDKSLAAKYFGFDE